MNWSSTGLMSDFGKGLVGVLEQFADVAEVAIEPVNVPLRFW